MQSYYGTYARFDTVSKKEAASLLGADNLAGDRFKIVFKKEEDAIIAWIENRFGALIGHFDIDISRQLNIYHARGWKLQALLSFVAYSDVHDSGLYWGEMAVICYDPQNDAESFERFINGIGKSLAEGIRPEIDLGDQGVKQIQETKGDWLPSKRTPLPERKAGTVIMKRRRSLSEKMIEQGRRGNKGCYAVSWIFIAAIIAIVLVIAFFGFKSCGAF